MTFIRFIGNLAISFFAFIGQLCDLVYEVLISLFRGRFYWSQLMKQIVEIGFRSQLVVILTGAKAIWKYCS